MGKLLLLLLWPVEKIYKLIIVCRNYYFDNLFQPKNIGKSPFVISVGNLSMGGTGKTPICIAVFRYFKKIQKTGILLRGYASDKAGFSDEASIYKKHFGESSVYVGADRSKNLCIARERGVEVAILDDGFQHRKVARNLNIVLVDMLSVPYDDKCIPRGFLREPVSALKRADWLILTRCDQVEKSEIESFETRVRSDFSHLKVFYSEMKVNRLSCVQGEEYNPKDACYLIVCGIGNPQNFIFSVKEQGVKVCGELIYSDHHIYSDVDFNDITKACEKYSANAILTTEKDWVKWQRVLPVPVVVLEVEAEVVESSGRSLEESLQGLNLKNKVC